MLKQCSLVILCFSCFNTVTVSYNPLSISKASRRGIISLRPSLRPIPRSRSLFSNNHAMIRLNTSLKSTKFPRGTKTKTKKEIATFNLNGNKIKSKSSSSSTSSSSINNNNNKLWSVLQKASEDEDAVVINIEAIILLSLAAAATYFFSQNPMVFQFVTNVFSSNPTESLSRVVDSIESMGSAGILYFGIIYTIAELLAVPATPLTLSAGYLFGVQQGTAIVLFSAILSATISFAIARTVLRTKVEGLLQNYPEFQKIDKAIGKEGFKLMLLIRLSPIFPFSLSNYLYGVTSVKFWPYFWGTSLGFAPGTIAYVYTGTVGKALTIDAGTATSQPTYLIAGLIVLAGLVKLLADVATGIIQELDDVDDDE